MGWWCGDGMPTHALGRKYDLIGVGRVDRRRVRADRHSGSTVSTPQCSCKQAIQHAPRAQTSDTIHHGSKFDPEQVTGIIEGIRNEGLDTIRAKASETFPDSDDRVFYEVALAEPDSRGCDCGMLTPMRCL